jgi:hypothetical protein
VVEKPVEQTVQLHDERVLVERRPVDRSISDRDRDATVTEIRETREELVISKQDGLSKRSSLGRPVRIVPRRSGTKYAAQKSK